MRQSFLRPVTPDSAPRIVRDEIEVAPPDEVETGEPLSAMRTVAVPAVMALLIIAVGVMMWRAGKTVGVGGAGMMLGGLVYMLAGQGHGSGGTSRAKLLANRKSKMRGLSEAREKVFSRGLSMHQGLQYAYPDPLMLPALIGTKRMWEVTPTRDGFTALRYGLGEVELAARIVAPEAPPGEFLDPVGWVSTVRFLRHNTTVAGMPLAMAAGRFPAIGVTGDRAAALGMLRAMLLHAAVTHGPDNLALVVLTDNPDCRDWSWAKWLPHTRHPLRRDQLGAARMMYSDWSTLTEALGGDEDHPGLIDFTVGFDPHWQYNSDGYRHVLVVVDSANPDKLIDSAIAPHTGVTWLLVNPPADALTASEGVTLRVDPDRTVWRSEADAPGDGPAKVAVADQVSVDEARVTARKLARYEVADLGNVDRQSAQVERGRDWCTLMRIRDAGTIDPLERWSVISRYSDKRRLRIPIGFTRTGERLELDLKQAAEGGTGPHGLVIGTSGSGKSEYLRNFVINGVLTHSPDLLNFLLVDYKGGPTFLGMSDLPHVVGVITNMEQEKHLLARFKDMVNGEIVRRMAVLRAADELSARYDIKDIKDYEELRERGVDLAPMPSLIVLIDEFTDLITQNPDFAPVFEQIGRQGRSVGIHLKYASQNKDVSARLDKLEANIGYRIGLKTQTPQESRALLNGSDAAYRLPGTPGHGVLLASVGEYAGELLQFYTGYTGARYFAPPAEAPVTPQPGDTRIPADTGFAPPRAFTAAAVPLPAGVAVEVPAEPQRSKEELENAETLFTTVVHRVVAADWAAPYRMCLPPLETTTLDAAEPGLRQWSAPANTSLPRLAVPMGLFDQPFKHAQPAWILDTNSQNVLILGGAQTGKSTTVKTLACSLALHNTPEQVQMYLLDGSGGGLEALRGLPHVGGVATRGERDAVERMLAQMNSLLAERARLFSEHGIASMEDYRRLRTDPNSPLLAQDPYGDVYLIIDGWDAFVAEGQVLQHRGGDLEPLINGSLNYGIHFAISTTRVADMRAIEPHLGMVIELDCDTKTTLSRIDNALARDRRAAPGHVIVTGHSLQGLVALPRIDGVEDRGSAPAGLAALVSVVAEQFAASAAERLRTLPTSITRPQLAAMVAEADQRARAAAGGQVDPRRRLRIALGMREDTLGVSYAEMWREPHLLIAGQPRSGKSESVGTVLDSIEGRFPTLDDAAVILYDKKRRHLDRLGSKNLFAHVTNDDEFLAAAYRLWREYNLDARDLPANVDAATRAARSWWRGPEVFIVIDDYHLVGGSATSRAAAVHKALPWLDNEPLARGLHFVIARNSEGLAIAAGRDPILGRMVGDMVPTVMLSGNKMDQIGEVKFRQLGIPGRAQYVQAGSSGVGRIQLAWSGVLDDDAEVFTD